MKINQLRKNQKPNQPEQKLPNQPKQQKAQPQQSKSPNLLQTVLSDSPKEKQQFRVSKFAIGLIILIQVLFIGLSIFNSATNARIDNLQTQVRNLEERVLELNDEELLVRDVIVRTEYLKTHVQERTEFGAIAESFVTSLPNNITLLKSFIQDNNLSITVESEAPLEISLLIAKYFDDGLAQEIVIQSANLNNSTKTFVATLEVIF